MTRAYDETVSFDVTCVIGTVTFDPYGTVSPLSAAFDLIATHECEGRFSFELPENGTTYTVTVEIDHPA